MPNLRTVYISQGSLKGKLISSKFGYDYCSFQGIPYAKPPVGRLRFKSPQPPETWEGTRSALQEGNRAPHFDMVTKLFTGDEDCLFLNIYTPKVDYNNCDTELKPVMVYFHGGGFAFGHGDTDVYGPEFLIQHDIILITLNYRLGVLGFLNLECPEASGNLGLKDQVAALKWVQKEIHHFGGDASNVTIFGESAGGVCVHLHMLSNMSTGLFHKAIAQSGNALCNWAFTNCHKRRAFNLAHILGFQTENTHDLLEFLYDVPPIKFAELQDNAICSKLQMSNYAECFKCSEESLQIEGIDQAFVPSIENNEQGETFLSDSPIKLMESGKMHDVPFITGVTAHEGICVLNSIIKNPLFLNQLTVKLNDMIPEGFCITSENKNKIASEIKKFYFKNDVPTLEEDIDGIVDFYTDYNFLLAMTRMIRLFKDNCTSPIYCYQFTYDGAFGWYKRLMAKHRKMSFLPKGVCHADDLGYIFTNTVLGVQNTNPNSDEMTVAKNITRLWTNFAKTGNPTPNDFPTVWTPTTKEQIKAFGIDVNLKPVEVLEKIRLDFWNSFVNK